MAVNLFARQFFDEHLVVDVEDALGVRLAIDDFGVGYSSLAQIKRFPINTLKVDKSIIDDIPSDRDDRVITEAIIAMGRTLSLTVVVEGVETVEQESILRGQSCDQSQGYYFSRPLTPGGFRPAYAEKTRALAGKLNGRQLAQLLRPSDRASGSLMPSSQGLACSALLWVCSFMAPSPVVQVVR